MTLDIPFEQYKSYQKKLRNENVAVLRTRVLKLLKFKIKEFDYIVNLATYLLKKNEYRLKVSFAILWNFLFFLRYEWTHVHIYMSYLYDAICTYLITDKNIFMNNIDGYRMKFVWCLSSQLAHVNGKKKIYLIL